MVPGSDEAGDRITRAATGTRQHLMPVTRDGTAVDQATIVGYAFGYLATMVAVFFMFLPVLGVFGLLLLLAAATQLVLLLLKAIGLGLYRGATGLWKSLARWGRTLLDKRHGGPGGEPLMPH